MTSALRIAANRQNAQKSTGPRSAAGKSRSRRNAFRHGLSAFRLTSSSQEEVDQLARKIVGETVDVLTFEQARAAADAQLQLVYIRRLRVAFIDRMNIFGSFSV